MTYFWQPVLNAYPLPLAQLINRNPASLINNAGLLYWVVDVKHLGDICQINGAEIAPVDVVIGGSPCQDLSLPRFSARRNIPKQALALKKYFGCGSSSKICDNANGCKVILTAGQILAPGVTVRTSCTRKAATAPGIVVTCKNSSLRVSLNCRSAFCTKTYTSRFTACSKIKAAAGCSVLLSGHYGQFV